MKEDEKLRLFVGSYIDCEMLFSHTNIQENIKEYFDCPIKFVEKDKIHLTWKFIGDAKSNIIPSLIKHINRITSDISDISINFNQFEIWPNSRHPRLLVITGSDVNGNATKLYKLFNSKFQKLGINKEKRKFNPHITVARFKIKQKPQKEFDIPEWLCIEEKKLDLKKIELINSFLSPQGSDYKTIENFNL